MITNSVQNEKSNKVHNRSSKKNLEVGAMGEWTSSADRLQPRLHPLSALCNIRENGKNRRQKVDNLWSDSKYERCQSAFDPMKLECFCLQRWCINQSWLQSRLLIVLLNFKMTTVWFSLLFFQKKVVCYLVFSFKRKWIVILL